MAITNGYLLPFRVVSTLFRGKYLAALRQAYREGKLRLPKGLNEEGLHKLLNRLRYPVCRAPLITTMESPRATGPPLVIPEVVTTG